jgi:hypothetical protein
MRTQPDFETAVAGIPCGVVIESYTAVAGSFSRNAASDLDYYGYTECDWRLVDRRGYPAAWLEKKLSSDDESRIEGEISAYMKASKYDDYY